MQANNNLGFVVWGVKNGFQNNLFSHNLSESIRTSLVDIQELCMPQYGVFYSIERIGSDTLVSLYDPTVMDYSGSRKAYIVFSIIFPAGFSPASNIFDLLESFRNYYKIESNGLASNEIFLRKLNEFNVKSASLSNANFGTTIGYKNYETIGELTEIFSDIDILDYRKVYFFDRPNSYVTSNPNFIAVTSLERKYTVDLINYNPHDFQITINSLQVSKEQLHIQGPYAKLINLTRYDKIEIKRGGSQPVASFNANEKNRVDLPKTQPATPKEIIFRNLDPSKHEVRINGVTINTTKTENGVFIFPISTQNVKVEIIDRNSKQVIQTNDTAISKEYEVRVLTANSGGTVGTTQTGQSGTGGYGGSTATGHTGGITNSGGGAIIGDDKPRKKSKAGLIITLSSVVVIAVVLIIGSQTNWFGLFNEKPKITEGTKNAIPQEGTKNVVPEPEDSNEDNGLVAPEGYTVKPGKEAILTEKGLEINSAYHRFYQGKWETKPKNADGSKGKWNEIKKEDKAYILSTCFDKKKEEIKQTGGDTPTPTPQPPKVPKPQPPKDPNDCTIAKAALLGIEKEAVNSLTLTPVQKVQKINDLEKRLNDVKDKYASCDNLNFNKVQSAINSLK